MKPILLALCMAMAVLWVRSYWRYDHCELGLGWKHTCGGTSVNGTAALCWWTGYSAVFGQWDWFSYSDHRPKTVAEPPCVNHLNFGIYYDLRNDAGPVIVRVRDWDRHDWPMPCLFATRS